MKTTHEQPGGGGGQGVQGSGGEGSRFGMGQTQDLRGVRRTRGWARGFGVAWVKDGGLGMWCWRGLCMF